MIEGNVIKFGYGDVVVSSYGMGYVDFTNIKPPIECGSTVKKDMNLEYGLSIRIHEDKHWELYDLIKTVNKDNRIVQYKGYVLDFSNYNEESVRVVREKAYNTINIIALAC
ncbi:hypothetical protein ACR77J_07800 [Tissierella praeacuta]|uniref:hypothetical protein n=1 Tax=Tissierella praeacuta TaxID=43131 RepID=UPI003DA5356D